MRRFAPSIFMWVLFEVIAVVLWQTQGNVFYLFNFSYIGTCIALGLALFALRWRHARRFVQFAVGLYMLVGLGFIGRENMQIEGFWYYLALGVFEGATIHYLIAKIAGPALFGRGWCGYACWTAMVLDLLPWKRSSGRRKGLGAIRYVVLAGSIMLVAALMALGLANDELMFWGLIIGNAVYYVLGIAMAAGFRDNRAFCKYFCPIGILMKPGAYVSLARIKFDPEACIGCHACERACPMDVDMRSNARNRTNGTECILCTECITACPKGALKL